MVRDPYEHESDEHYQEYALGEISSMLEGKGNLHDIYDALDLEVLRETYPELDCYTDWFIAIACVAAKRDLPPFS